MSALDQPTLPVPLRTRWQPLRLGLVELFHYDSEEFWFRDGHLLLRGNNGTGKSKVLSLTLPLLFDAQLKSSRVEPDGDAGKKMSWNLLLGERDRRMGYTWIEFGRVSESGDAEYLTLGCGLFATAARPTVDSWFFVLEGSKRIGADLWLTSPQRVVLTRERLREALQGAGQVFDTSTAYRRAVDERLFHLGTARYAALMDTLIQLRQPQLSKKPDEASLSNALTEALPPMSSDLLSDVAEALNQLEEIRRELQDYEALERAVSQFNQRYQIYAATQARRRARVLRSAQTAFDSASRALNETRVQLAAAQASEALARKNYYHAETDLAANRTRLDALQSDPAMQDANRLEQAERDAHARHKDAENAQRTRAESHTRYTREQQVALDRSKRVAQAELALHEARIATANHAQHTGLGEICANNSLTAMEIASLAALQPLAVETANKDVHRAVDARRQQVAVMHNLCAEVVQTEDAWGAQLQVRDERKDEADEAINRRALADESVEQQGQHLLASWQSHFDNLQQLRVDASAPLVETLAAWVANLHGENPARSALHAAQQSASERLAQHHAALTSQRQTIDLEHTALQGERQRLTLGEDSAPPPSLYRAITARDNRAGAPLWQLVEFRESMNDSRRAGLEAALQASGLLDAWVTPDGALHTLDNTGQPLRDTQWMARPKQPQSLALWLLPSAPLDPHKTTVPAAIVQRLLEGVACGAVDDGVAEAWVSADGRFRLGALAGAWSKAAAEYVGFVARAAARARRIEAIDLRQAEIANEQAELHEQFDQHQRDQQQAAREWATAPNDEALRAAHVDATARAREYQAAHARLTQAEQKLQAAAALFESARTKLEREAADLHLPDTRAALRDIEQSLLLLTTSLHALLHSVRELRSASAELAEQQTRERDAALVAEQSASAYAERCAVEEDARIRFETLRESVGVQVDELQLRLRAARYSVALGDKAVKDSNEALRSAAEERARLDQRTQSDEGMLVDKVTARHAAVASLHGFALTGLLASAVPDAEVPDVTAPWNIELALALARRMEQVLSNVKDSDDDWTRVQSQISQDYTELGRTLTALSHQAQMDSTEFGLVVNIVYQNRPERPGQLSNRLTDEITQRRELLTASERKILENHLQAEIAATVQKLLRDAEQQVRAINVELEKRPTSTGVRFRLLWQPLPEGAEGAPIGLEAARKRLLNTSTDLWSAEDRSVVGEMLQQRINGERSRADTVAGGTLLEQLARALDYRRWHRFRVERWQDGRWRPLSGPASSGERALGLTVPLFAAVSSYYTQSGYPHAPRLVLLDEAFAGIDDNARAHCMGLIHEFDLDFVITSEREWACYAELPGVAICQLQRREGIDAVHVSRWAWDGRARRPDADPDRRFQPIDSVDGN